MNWRKTIAVLIAPEEFDALEKGRTDLELEINRRVAEVLLKMDPFEPFLKKYNVIFSEEWERPEDRLNDQSRTMLFQWAYGLEGDPSWKHLTDWVRNTQGNATLRKGRHSDEWFYGRAAVIVVGLFVDEVRRLSSHYKEILAQKGHTFDPHLVVDEN